MESSNDPRALNNTGQSLVRLSLFNSVRGHHFAALALLQARLSGRQISFDPKTARGLETSQGRRSPPGSADFGMAKNDNRSSDVNPRHLVRGQYEWYDALSFHERFGGRYVIDLSSQSRGRRVPFDGEGPWSIH